MHGYQKKRTIFLLVLVIKRDRDSWDFEYFKYGFLYLQSHSFVIPSFPTTAFFKHQSSTIHNEHIKCIIIILYHYHFMFRIKSKPSDICVTVTAANTTNSTSQKCTSPCSHCSKILRFSFHCLRFTVDSIRTFAMLKKEMNWTPHFSIKIPFCHAAHSSRDHIKV